MPVLPRTNFNVSPCQWRVFPEVFWPCVRRGKDEAKISRTVQVATCLEAWEKDHGHVPCSGLSAVSNLCRNAVVLLCHGAAVPAALKWAYAPPHPGEPSEGPRAALCVGLIPIRTGARRAGPRRPPDPPTWVGAVLTTTIDQHHGLPEHGPQGRLRVTGTCPDPIAPAHQRDLHRAPIVQVGWRGEPW